MKFRCGANQGPSRGSGVDGITCRHSDVAAIALFRLKSDSNEAGRAEIDDAVHVTGEVSINRYVVAQDVGYAINPTHIEGQIEGGVAWGIRVQSLPITAEKIALRLQGENE